MEIINSVFNFLIKGGPVMWPLMLASVLALGAGIERLLYVRKARLGAEETIEAVTTRLDTAGVDEARGMALRVGGPVARVMAAGLDNWPHGVKECENAMVEAAMAEREDLTRRLSILDTVITVAPLLGLLGTVTGMIRAFRVVGSGNEISSPHAITGGVAEALIATATGLAIAIFALVIFNYLNERVRQIVALMEIAGTRLVNIRSKVCRREEQLDATESVSA